MAYNLIRHPPRLRFWLRALSPLTPLFGGIKITESNTRYTLFCNMIAVGKGAVIFTEGSTNGSSIHFQWYFGDDMC